MQIQSSAICPRSNGNHAIELLRNSISRPAWHLSNSINYIVTKCTRLINVSKEQNAGTISHIFRFYQGIVENDICRLSTIIAQLQSSESITFPLCQHFHRGSSSNVNTWLTKVTGFICNFLSIPFNVCLYISFILFCSLVFRVS